ncbi:hypothetical protein J1N39_23435 [Pseudomonas aeruginosa]|uniref:hypothetical protein n=1 Tax=Pseudomonas aeruginosa TaxID=287 RepID=UPI001CBFBA23|nr:hypothetical protein [Pseudomonas aeruginosa]MBZ3677433.1 hypothetical protein [Pseudomonas aeruginosa]MBZ3688428.1 hypothetical protein [Pseudomonas aeruginosa]
MNPTIKAFLIAAPVAILVQGLLIIFAVAQFGEDVNMQLLSVIGVGTGLVSFFTIKKHLVQRQRKS